MYKLLQNFTEGNTRKVSACFLRLYVCDVIQFRDDHARTGIRDPLSPFARLSVWEGDGSLVCPVLKLLLSILRHVFGDENLEWEICTLWIGWLASCISAMAAKIRLLSAVVCYFLFSKGQFVLCPGNILAPPALTGKPSCKLVGESHHDWYSILAFVSAPQTTPRTANLWGNILPWLVLPCSMIVAIEQISFIGWNSCIPRIFLF